MKTVSAKRFHGLKLLGCCLALWLAGCAPKIYQGPYVPPPPPPKRAPAPQVSRPIFYVAATRLNLRGCAGMDCPKISVLQQNEMVEKIGELDDWCEVIVKRDGSRGWVNSRYLSPEPVTPAVVTPPPAVAPPPEVTPPPPAHLAPAPPPREKPAPVKPPAMEKPKPPTPAPPKRKPEEPGPPKTQAPVQQPVPEKPAPPAVKPAQPEKPAPPKEPETEQPKKIRIM